MDDMTANRKLIFPKRQARDACQSPRAPRPAATPRRLPVSIFLFAFEFIGVALRSSVVPLTFGSTTQPPPN
jgi:hypothetical protein